MHQLSRGGQALLLALLALPCFLPAAAAQTPDPGVAVVGVDRQGPNLVTLVAAVRPPSGARGDRAVPSFRVVEEGQVQPDEAQRVPANRLEVALLLDLPEDEPSAQSAIRGAAVEFLLQLPDTARVAVVGGETPGAAELTAPATAIVQVGEVAEGPQRMVRDGVRSAATLQREDDENRRVVVAVSANPDPASRRSVQSAANDLAAAGAAFYGVVFEQTEGNRAALDGLAEAAGGEVLVAAQAAELVSVYDRIARDLTNLYEVAYEPAAAGRSAVSLAVESTGFRAEVTRTVPAQSGTALDLSRGDGDGTATETARNPATQASGSGLLAPALAVVAGVLGAAALLVLGAAAVVGAGLLLRRRRQPAGRQQEMSGVRREAERRWTEERKRAAATRRAGSVVPLAPSRPSSTPSGRAGETIRLPEARPHRVIRLPETAAQPIDAGVYSQPLRDALVGEVVASLWGIGPRFAEVAWAFRGQRVTAVRARGPHVLMTFSGSNLVLHTELGSGGMWAVYPVGAPWQRPRRLSRAMVETADATAVCFAPRVCQLLRADQVQADPDLALSFSRR